MLGSTVWAQQVNVRITTGGTTGSFFPHGAGMAEYINIHSDFLRATPATSGGGTENVRRLATKGAEFGFCYPGDLLLAWNAEEPFKDRIQNLRLVGPGQAASIMHMFVLEKSGITSVEQLAGKKFVPSAPGATAGGRVVFFLKAIGLYDKMSISYMSWGDLPDRLKTGVIDGYARSGPFPVADIVQISLTHKVRVLDLGPAMEKSSFLQKYPFMFEEKIPANTYTGQTKALTSFSEATFWTAHKDVPDKVVAEFLRLAYTEETAKHLDAAYKGHAHRELSMMTKIRSVPLHPAAQKFWKEKGIQVPEPAVK
ncbi:MAG: hypothetical protein A2170_09265 [Deltaproteobacteria bacterium RBG_13_53_10]|nr:MAG: hypothetical protein A2170_09265 [Deltaproteobacteria bacterium RBG_13_53_10]